jgi:phage-related holin
MIGKDYIRDAMIIGFATNEMISIVENAGLMGVKLPPIVVSAIDLLQKRSEETDKGDENDG